MWKGLITVLVLLIVIVGLALVGIARGWLGRHEGPGVLTEQPVPPALVAARADLQASTAQRLGLAAAKQILFGDLHVHTTVSSDAFLTSLPMLGGEGAHPQGDACDYARFCSALDFWSITDHAEALTPRRWRETIESIRQCNAVAGEARNPDVVAYLGWEWTQVGATPETHYGHKNVILGSTEEAQIPARPIASRFGGGLAGIGVPMRVGLFFIDPSRRVLDMALHSQELSENKPCPEGVPVRELPADCQEVATTPGLLFEKLADWGHQSIVIPHGTAWGWTAPSGASFDQQLTPEQHDPNRQTLVEVYSGHGNSEEYRDSRAVLRGPDGELVCPEPSDVYLPSCWRAGEIIRGRCEAEGLPAEECETRAADARRFHVEGGKSGFLTVPGATPEDWLDSGQCRDCFLPAYDYRSGMSVQYMLALSNFDGGGEPLRFRPGFIGSSDVHTGRPGTGYKEVDRREMTEATGLAADASSWIRREQLEPASRPVSLDLEGLPPFMARDVERSSSFFLTGGLIAVHSRGRDRASIWEAMERKEVYGTSGGRTLLWFDLLNSPDGDPVSMGSEVTMDQAPQFRVRAAGALQQEPGCPDYASSALSPERLHDLCRGECYHPSDERKRITRIEVVRIRPQVREGEPVAELIEDPWRSFSCDPDPAGCQVTFSDPGFSAAARDVLYYVRAIEEPSDAVNGANLRCEFDERGRCLRTDPCYGDERLTPYQEDCLAPVEERAWSSPIFVNFGG